MYDLGCGDGTVPILAAKKFGCRARGIDLDPALVARARAGAAAAGVGDRCTFVTGRIEEAGAKHGLRDATVVYLFQISQYFPTVDLLGSVLDELRPGTFGRYVRPSTENQVSGVSFEPFSAGLTSVVRGIFLVI